MDIIAGGYAGWRPATEEIQDYCDQVKSDVEKKTGKNCEEYRAVIYNSQVVAGMNYSIMVYVGDFDFILIKILENLPCYGGKVELIDVREIHTKDDHHEPF